MTKRPLTSDELGEKGEARFREMCADEKLICNKSDRDRAGWDFIVDFPFDAVEDRPTLDQRPAPLSCRVQVKTVWSSTKRVGLRLSSAERLAKDPKPSFVLVLVVDPHLRFHCASLIHLRGGSLARILKRLRQAHAKGARAVNDTTITFDATSAGTPLPLNVGALSAAVRAAVGEDTKAYAVAKGQELETLGYDQARYTLNTTMQAGNMDELVEGFLGLRPLDLTEFKSFETRFGLTLPVDEHTSEDGRIEFRIEPHPADRCEVSAFPNSGGPPARFAGDLFLPPIPVKMAHFQALVRTPFFSLHLKFPKMTFESHGDALRRNRFSSGAWRNWFRLVAGVYGQGVRVEIAPGKQLDPIQVAFNPEADPREAAWAGQMLAILDKSEALLAQAGSEPELVTLEELIDSASGVETAYGFREPTEAPGLVTFESERGAVSIERLEMVHANVAWVLGRWLAYGGLLEMKVRPQGEGLRWQSVQLKVCDLRDIGPRVDRYAAFVRDLKARTGVQDGVIAEISSFPSLENSQLPNT